MKLVSLNTWGACQGRIFFDYIKELAPQTDIFCFQEIFSAEPGAPQTFSGWRMFGLEELACRLAGFVPYFAVKSTGFADDSENRVNWPVKHGMAIFVRKNFLEKNYTVHKLYDTSNTGAPPIEGTVNVQVLTMEKDDKTLHIINIHGMSRPGNKLDTPERLLQSRKLLDIIADLPKGPVILCGDFNLMPETESIKILEGRLKNLIKGFKINNTRNQISWKKYNNVQHFADYTFVSPEVKVTNFEVPYNEVSDHLPMILDFIL